jgi:hypothetical protein
VLKDAVLVVLWETVFQHSTVGTEENPKNISQNSRPAEPDFNPMQPSKPEPDLWSDLIRSWYFSVNEEQKNELRPAAHKFPDNDASCKPFFKQSRQLAL